MKNIFEFLRSVDASYEESQLLIQYLAAMRMRKALELICKLKRRKRGAE